MEPILNENLVDAYFKAFAKTVSDTKLYPIAAIWLDKAVITSKERKCRIVAGDEICIENGQIINCSGKPTHRITKCYATITGYAPELAVLNLSTHEIETIKL